MSGGYTFRPAGVHDLPLLERWLRTAEVVRWWGDPQEQAALLREDLDDPRMVMRIVSLAGRPFAYAQDYDVHRWPQAHFADLPAGSRAIDSFIGEPDMLGRGHGSNYLRLLAAQLRVESVPVVAIDPDAHNLPERIRMARLEALRSWEKANDGEER